MQLTTVQFSSLKTKKITKKFGLLYPCGSLVFVGSKKSCLQIINLQKSNETVSTSVRDNACNDSISEFSEANNSDSGLQTPQRNPKGERISTEGTQYVPLPFKSFHWETEDIARACRELTEPTPEQRKRSEQLTNSAEQHRINAEKHRVRAEQYRIDAQESRIRAEQHGENAREIRKLIEMLDEWTRGNGNKSKYRSLEHQISTLIDSSGSYDGLPRLPGASGSTNETTVNVRSEPC